MFKEHAVSGKQILEMRITEGENKVYCTVPDNHFYIRKGSNNMIPDPDTELPQLYNQKRSYSRRSIQSLF